MEQKKNPTGQLLSRRQMLRMMGGAAGVAALAACALLPHRQRRPVARVETPQPKPLPP
ncbi:MAG: hypothetical protein R2873_05315 [Caldilineaceae bacterium]